MLDEGLVHLLATDAHDVKRRIPNLSRARDAAAHRVGDAEAEHLVLTRARGVLANDAPESLPAPVGAIAASNNVAAAHRHGSSADGCGGGSRSGWLRRFFG